MNCWYQVLITVGRFTRTFVAQSTDVAHVTPSSKHDPLPIHIKIEYTDFLSEIDASP